MLAEAQQKLKEVVNAKVQEAIDKQQHDNVMRFIKLYAPLRLQVQCIQQTSKFQRLHGTPLSCSSNIVQHCHLGCCFSNIYPELY